MKPISYREAVEYSRKYFVALSKTSDNTSTPKGIHEPGGLRANMLAARGVRRVLDEPEKIIAEAEQDVDAFDSLRFAAAQHLDLGMQMPPVIYRWVGGYLTGKKQRPRGTGGRPSSFGMKTHIFYVVSALTKRGMEPSRNDASPSLSACDAVADALTGLAMSPTSYEQVSDIYFEVKNLQGGEGAIRLDIS